MQLSHSGKVERGRAILSRFHAQVDATINLKRFVVNDDSSLSRDIREIAERASLDKGSKVISRIGDIVRDAYVVYLPGIFHCFPVIASRRRRA